MPLKILSIEEAEKLGLRKKFKKKSGNAIMSVGQIVRGGDGQPDRTLETYTITESNKKQLIFMSEERKEELKREDNFIKYLEQFDKIPENLNE